MLRNQGLQRRVLCPVMNANEQILAPRRPAEATVLPINPRRISGKLTSRMRASPCLPVGRTKLAALYIRGIACLAQTLLKFLMRPMGMAESCRMHLFQDRRPWHEWHDFIRSPSIGKLRLRRAKTSANALDRTSGLTTPLQAHG